MAISRDDALDGLDSLGEAVRAQFDDTARRQQFERHLATTAMCLSHLFDEADRASNQ